MFDADSSSTIKIRISFDRGDGSEVCIERDFTSSSNRDGCYILLSELIEECNKNNLHIVARSDEATLSFGDDIVSLPILRSAENVPCVDLSSVKELSVKFYDPGLRNTMVVKSDISFINGTAGKLSYKGMDLVDIVGKHDFTDLIFLFLRNELPSDANRSGICAEIADKMYLENYQIARITEMLENKVKPMSIISSIVSSFESYNTGDDDYSNVLTCISKIPVVIGVILNFLVKPGVGYNFLEPKKSLSFSDNVYRVMFGADDELDAAGILDILMILHVEHGQNASTFASTCTASTGASIFNSVCTGINTLAGPLHGGANEKVMNLLKEISAAENCDEYIDSLIDGASCADSSKRKLIPGTGHRVYKGDGDPRAMVLHDMLMNNSALVNLLHVKPDTAKLFRNANKLYSKIINNNFLKEKGVVVNVDYWSGIVFDAIGIPTELLTPMFVSSRVVGWCAHCLSYQKMGSIIRPDQIYTGVNRD